MTITSWPEAENSVSDALSVTEPPTETTGLSPNEIAVDGYPIASEDENEKPKATANVTIRPS